MTTIPAPVAAPTGHYVTHAEGPDGKVPLDVTSITRTVSATLRPVPADKLDPDVLAGRIRLLTGHIGLLLPSAEARQRQQRPDPAKPGIVGHGLAYVRRRMDFEPPDPYQYPVCAQQWAEESAHCVQQLLGLVLDDGQHQPASAGVEENR